MLDLARKVYLHITYSYRLRSRMLYSKKKGRAGLCNRKRLNYSSDEMKTKYKKHNMVSPRIRRKTICVA
jgi:hypothetical protein